jgi:protein involved in polysaccharide export with SLBB domain
MPATPFGIPGLRYGIPFGDEGENPNWRYSSTRDPNLIGLPFGSNETGSHPTSDGMTDGGLDCTPIPAEATAASGINDRFTPYNPSLAPATSGAAGSNPAGGSLLTNGMPQNSDNSNLMSATSASVGSTTIASSSAGQFKPRNDVKLSEPDIDWSYAVIERQSKVNLTTSLLPFNLGKLVLEGDVSQNLELLPGDVVTIFSKADIRVPQAQQTRYVRLEGEVISSGVYSVLPGETLRHLVERAGGVTADAYLYGSEFTRESTRRVQQQRLNEYIDQITVQVSANATNNFGRSLNVSDSTAATAAAQQNQNVINSLRQIRATGRIVLELPVDAKNVSQLPDLPLEDGDRLIVPRIPSTVNVEGAVYNQNSFVFDSTRRVGSYIRLAGGANRDADTSRAYVIRASGSVLSKQYSSSLIGNNFDSLHIYPGDTVVVPLNLTKGQTLKTIVSIAQIVGQLGIAVAAGNTVF